MAALSVIIVSYNTATLLRECLVAVLDQTQSLAAEIIVVDNASSDDSVAMTRRDFPSVRLIVLARNVGFGAANNAGVGAATAPYVMLLNSDAVLLADTGAGLVRYLVEHPGVICAGPRIVLPDGKPQPRVFGHQPSLWRIAMQSLGGGMLLPRVAWLEGMDGFDRPGPAHEVGWISGVCMAMRRDAFLAAGGFDPEIFMYCEDVDLCHRLAAGGGRIVVVNGFPVRHYGGASSPSTEAQLRNTVWQQRNLLKLVRGRNSPGKMRLAVLALSLGLVLRCGAGLALIPRRGVRANILLRASWLRLRDLAG